jgi:hypothetical protein
MWTRSRRSLTRGEWRKGSTFLLLDYCIVVRIVGSSPLSTLLLLSAWIMTLEATSGVCHRFLTCTGPSLPFLPVYCASLFLHNTRISFVGMAATMIMDLVSAWCIAQGPSHWSRFQRYANVLLYHTYGTGARAEDNTS